MWPFELHAGVLRSAGRGSLPLSAVSAVRVDARVDAPMDARVGGGTQREPRRARPAELVLEAGRVRRVVREAAQRLRDEGVHRVEYSLDEIGR